MDYPGCRTCIIYKRNLLMFLDAELSQNTAALCGNGCDYFIKIFPGGSTDRDIGL